jgi:cytosine deaminase
VAPARALGVQDYGLEEGAPASLVVYDAPGELDAIRLIPRRRLVLRRGRVVARTEPAQTTVTWDGREETVDFLPAHDSSASAR